MPHHRDNFILNLLEPDVFNQIEPQLSIIDLQREQVLAETHQRIEKVYFPHSGIISCVVANDLRQQAEAHEIFRAVLIKYDQFFLAQVQQHVACNAVHTVQARTCKWLCGCMNL